MPGVVSLSYDGSCISHLETALPQLDQAKLRGTFFADPPPLLDSYPAWRTAEARGHEIGNGSLISIALPDGRLPRLSTTAILEDLAECDDLLAELFPAQGFFPLGLPIGRAACADSEDYSTELLTAHPVIRTGRMGINRRTGGDGLLATVDASDLAGPQLCQLARQAAQGGEWLIFSFGGIGVGERSTDAAAHAELIEFLLDNNDLIEVLPIGAAARKAGVKAASTLH